MNKLERREDNSIWGKLSGNWIFTAVCYLVGCTLIGYVTLAPRPANAAPMKWTRLENSLFISLSRPSFLIGLILWMLPMFLGKANIFKNLWSANFWVPISRLTYVCYLISPITNAVLFSTMPSSLYLSYMTIFGLVWFSFIFNIVAAFFIHIFLEAPLMNLILSRQVRTKEKMVKNDQLMLYYLEKQEETTAAMRYSESSSG